MSEASGENVQVLLYSEVKNIAKVDAATSPARLLQRLEILPQSGSFLEVSLTQGSSRQPHNSSRREWPCRLPEGCDDMYSPATSDIPLKLTANPEDPTATLLSSSTVHNNADEGWLQRYGLYQRLITEASEPLIQIDVSETPALERKVALHILHGREDVQSNAGYIQATGHNFPGIPPAIVAAAIAEQASDVERLFGRDTLEKVALALPGLEDMSVGIAQLRPEEAQSLGLGQADLFDPQTAVEGMYIKINVANSRIDALEDPEAPLSLTERYMLLSLAQNSTSKVAEYFAFGGDWNAILEKGNNARVMRYFLVHLDWLLANGWELPPEVDQSAWREIVFSSP